MSRITAVHARFARQVDVMLWPLLAAPAPSLAALIGSAAILLLGDRAERASVWILSFAIGTLSGAATLHLLPEALETQPAEERVFFETVP